VLCCAVLCCAVLCIGFGCAYNSKQSTLTALMEPLGPSGLLHLLPGASVRVVTRGGDGLATGVSGTVTDPDSGASRPFRVLAGTVVVSGGALHTPAILLRSGFSNRKIGKHLTLHPVLGCAGLSPEAVTGLHQGVSMGVVVKGGAALELPSDPGYGVAVETPPVHPLLLGLVLNWGTGLTFKTFSLSWRNLLVYINISRDHSKESNRIALDKDGNFEVHYDLTRQDEANLMNGLVQTLRIMKATPGNKLVQVSHESMPPFVDMGNAAAFETFLEGVRAGGLVRGKYNVFSAHQMGSCRMAATPAEGPVSPEGCLFESANVFVADASLFPTSLGVNPMVTVEALAHMVSRSVMKRLNVKPAAQDW
jgi:choline dehydrogenase-like flavoprotein